MQVKTIAPAPKSDSGDVEFVRRLVTRSLPINAVAVALAASDLPRKRCRLSDDEAVAFAAQGVQRLGVAVVRAAGEEILRIHVTDMQLEEMGSSATAPTRAALIRRAVGLFAGRGVRSRQFCWDTAYQATGEFRRLVADFKAMQATTPAEVA